MSDEVKKPRGWKHQIGIVGLAVGLIAIGVAAFQNNLRPEPPPPEPEPTLKELAVDAGKKLIEEKILKKDSDSSADNESIMEERYDTVQLTYMGLGFVALILGVISWIRKDHIRISGGAVSLGLMAIAWQYVLIGIAVAVVILILASLSA